MGSVVPLTARLPMTTATATNGSSWNAKPIITTSTGRFAPAGRAPEIRPQATPKTRPAKTHGWPKRIAASRPASSTSDLLGRSDE